MGISKREVGMMALWFFVLVMTFLFVVTREAKAEEPVFRPKPFITGLVLITAPITYTKGFSDWESNFYHETVSFAGTRLGMDSFPKTPYLGPFIVGSFDIVWALGKWNTKGEPEHLLSGLIGVTSAVLNFTF